MWRRPTATTAPASDRAFFFNHTPTTEIYTLSLHHALPIYDDAQPVTHRRVRPASLRARGPIPRRRSEEHTSELQSRQYLVCRLLLEKKKKKTSREHKEQKKKKNNQ